MLLPNLNDEMIAIKSQFELCTALHYAMVMYPSEVAELLIAKAQVQDLAIYKNGMVSALAMNVSQETSSAERFAKSYRKVVAKVLTENSRI